MSDESDDDYEVEVTVSRDDAAAMLRALGDGVAAGAVRLGDDETVVDVPEWVDAEVEFETDDEVELEVELTWHPESGATDPAEDSASADEPVQSETDTTDGTEAADAPSMQAGASGSADDSEEPAVDSEESAVGENPARLVGAAEGAPGESGSKAHFELFEDRAGEWRWRLVHDNGNVIADSGEGYARRGHAENGLRSVMRNAPGADVTVEGDDR